MATIAKVSGMAKETGGSATVDTNRAYTDRRNREYECSNGASQSGSSVCIMQLICHRCW